MTSSRDNIILNTDSYKASHYKQYPPGTQYVTSYIESRGGRFDRTVFFGLQAFIKRYLTKPITKADVDVAEKIFRAHGEPFNREGWDYIVEKHNGFLPVKITALKEGTVVKVRNALVQIVNTDPKCFWLTSYLETALLRAVWYPTTVATVSWSIKQKIRERLERTCDDVAAVMGFMLNDFGARGVSSLESSELGGLGHLVNFMGTDNVPAILAAFEYYGAVDMPGFSIPAAEHSTITSWGGPDQEVQAFENMVDQFAENKILAVVSDSYNIYNACEKLWGETLKDKVIASGARVVVRPDSGDATTVPIKCVQILAEKFGFTVNGKGFKVLPGYIRVIQGDGINEDSIIKILENLELAGFSGENVCFGMGGALLQASDRDTQKFAMKACEVVIEVDDGKGKTSKIVRDVYKDPVDDKGKQSKRGRQAVVFYDAMGEYITIREDTLTGRQNHLEPVFENGILRRDQTILEIRALSEKK